MNKPLLETDVLIVGGGAAGIAAAVSAARQGSRVILLEKRSQSGGKATSAVVGTICGAHYRSSNPESRYVTEGFAKEFCEAVAAASKTKAIHHYQGNLHFLPYQPFPFALVADQFLTSEKLIHTYYHATITDVKAESEAITSVEFMNHKEKMIILPKRVIDCTGESTVSQLAGIPTFKEKQYQASAAVFSLENIVHEEPVKLSLNIIRAVKKAILVGEVHEALDKVSIVPGSVRANSIMVKIALPYRIDDDPDNKSRLEETSRKAVAQVSKAIIERVSFFSKAHVGFVAPEAGTRTGQLSVGQQKLSTQEVLNCVKKEDGIAKGAWPIENWPLGKNAELQFFAEDDHYEISAGCLISQHLKNLYFAGRQISADQQAIASARVIGTCLSTGFAAGVLAAYATQGKPMIEAISIIRKRQVEA